jgi:hypothetical protein
MSYSKLFSSIVHSSLWTEEDHVRLLFVTLLAIADREGHVYGSRNGLERAANIQYDVDAGDVDPWQALMEPDSDSADLMRNPENEGRRIEAVDGGFRILNYLYYRSLRNDDDRREQNREAQRKFRERSVSRNKPRSANVKRVKPESAHADADADAESRSKEEEIYLVYPRHEGKPSALRAIHNALCNGSTFEFLLERTQAYAATRAPRDKFTPLPATWFNDQRFNDDPSEWSRKDNGSKSKQRAPSGPAYQPVEFGPELTDEQIAKNKEVIAREKAILMQKFRPH